MLRNQAFNNFFKESLDWQQWELEGFSLKNNSEDVFKVMFRIFDYGGMNSKSEKQ